MANKNKKCRHCKEYSPFEQGITVPLGFFCSMDHVTAHGIEKQAKKRKQEKAKIEKASKAKHREAKAKIKKRTGKNGYYDNLKTALHYYIKHVLRKGEPCYTCGLPQKTTDSPQAFHVGHFMPAKMIDPRRFMLENLRMQCYSCNVPNSGRRAEYRQRLIEEMGIAHVEWLECEINHKSLKEKYPDIEDIKKDTSYYRGLSRKEKIEL